MDSVVLIEGRGIKLVYLIVDEDVSLVFSAGSFYFATGKFLRW